jgi:hypothetical protein
MGDITIIDVKPVHISNEIERVVFEKIPYEKVLYPVQHLFGDVGLLIERNGVRKIFTMHDGVGKELEIGDDWHCWRKVYL